MDVYDRMRRDMAIELDRIGINNDEILNTLDTVSKKYLIEERGWEAHDNQSILNDFLSCCEYEKMAKGTIENYGLVIGRMLKQIDISIGDIRTADLRNYLKEYQDERNISDSTANKYREYFRTFFGWCVNEKYCDTNPAAKLKPIRCEKKKREFYSQSDLELIRAACADERETAIIEFLYSTGCRVSELCGAKKSNIDWQNNTVQLFGKGKKHRISYLNAKASLHLKWYLESRTDNEEWLFLSKRGSHAMSPAGIQKILRGIHDRAGTDLNKKVTPHLFRHTTATTAMQHGMPVEDIQTLLGHENIDTTMIYASTCDENVRMNHRKYIM